MLLTFPVFLQSDKTSSNLLRGIVSMLYFGATKIECKTSMVEAERTDVLSAMSNVIRSSASGILSTSAF